MAYDLQLVQLNTNYQGLSASNTAWGFPANTNFHTLLMSYWMCGPYQTTPGVMGSPSVWPAFASAAFFGFNSGVSGITLSNQTLGPGSQFFAGSIPNPLPTSPLGCLLHFMMSVDTHAQIVQVYINDQPVPVTGTWTGTPPFDFNIRNSINIWAWDVANVAATGIHPTLGDAWISNTPSFVDLSVTANRRKFISDQMIAVDLGASGANPFGYQPAMYMSVRPTGVPADILINRGIGDGSWGYTQNPPTFQTDGVCVAIPIPPPPPTILAALSMDNVLVTHTTPPALSDQVFLEWSDDRGHSFGSPVGLPLVRGEYIEMLRWQRLGYARDRVFRISWSAPIPTALQGAWIDVEPTPET